MATVGTWLLMLTPAQIRAQVKAIRKRMANGSRVFAIHSAAGWTGPATIEVDGEEHQVVSCHSDLHVREVLLRSESRQQPCILLCSFAGEQLGDDVLARLAKRRVFHPQASEVLAELFGARVIDPRVLACKPLVESLIQNAPKDGYRPVGSGSLDLQTAWLSLIEVLLGERLEAPSLTGILAWSLDESKLRTYRGLTAALRGAMGDWLVRSRGAAAHFMMTAMAGGVGADLAPLGLLAGLLYRPECRGTSEARAALARLEQYFEHREIDDASAGAWAAAAGEFIETQAGRDKAVVQPLLAGLDRCLEQNRVPGLARLSRFSPAGLEARFNEAGLALAEAAQGATPQACQKALNALQPVEAHFLAAENALRIERVRMALRLLAWLEASEAPPPHSSLAQLAGHYFETGGFVDWARTALDDSDPVRSLREAYRDILRRTDERLAAFEQAFVAAFQRWNLEGSPREVLLPVEDVVGEILCPIVREQPALLLVLDGMSVAAFRQLLDDLLRRDWVEATRPELGLPRPVAAALPSLTTVSRWALFAGRLEESRTTSEKVEFARHQRLTEVLGNQSKPQLFTKGDLATGGELGVAPGVLSAIANRRNRAVAVVVNAMDDLLTAGDQVAVSWGLDSIRPLRELLHAARDSGRLVLLTSDHGHILDRTTHRLREDAADAENRFRSPGLVLMDGETEFKGRRVAQTTGPEGVVCLTKRDVRYLKEQRGYHGGASVQEVVIPLTALRHVATPLPKGWQDLAPFHPAWWDLNPVAGEALARSVRPARPSRTVTAPAVKELELFAHAEKLETVKGGDWFDAVAKTALYSEQMRRVARLPRLQEDLPRLVRALEARGGTMLRAALAQELGLPLFRLDGLVQNAGRVLNLDGYEVVACDRASETVLLNVALLKSQFGITQ